MSVTAGGAGAGGGDAARVVCSGAGLAGGVLGRELRAWLDTRRAGPGELTAHCTGPNKVHSPPTLHMRVETNCEQDKQTQIATNQD